MIEEKYNLYRTICCHYKDDTDPFSIVYEAYQEQRSQEKPRSFGSLDRFASNKQLHRPSLQKLAPAARPRLNSVSAQEEQKKTALMIPKLNVPSQMSPPKPKYPSKPIAKQPDSSDASDEQNNRRKNGVGKFLNAEDLFKELLMAKEYSPINFKKARKNGLFSQMRDNPVSERPPQNNKKLQKMQRKEAKAQEMQRKRQQKRQNKQGKKQKYIERGNRFFQQKNQGQYTHRAPIYKNYIPLKEIQDSRAHHENIYFKGRAEYSEQTKYYCRIITAEVEGKCQASGPNRNRSLQGDTVYFKIIRGGEQEAEKSATSCEIVAIEDTKRDLMIGKLLRTMDLNKPGYQNRQVRNNRQRKYTFIPLNKRFPDFDVQFVSVKDDWADKLENCYFKAEFGSWDVSRPVPKCQILDVFGEFGSIEVECAALLRMHGVKDQEYSEAQIEEGLSEYIACINEKGQYAIPAEVIKQRDDLRGLRIFTIDPLTARDFDDALSVRQLSTAETAHLGAAYGKKIYQIGVHIADVSFFVKEGSLIDKLAQESTTSVYLVHRVIPMLPRILCETMCSLNPGLQRLTVSAWCLVNEDGELREECRFSRSVIKSCARFTYEQAQKVILGTAKGPNDIQPGYGCVNPLESRYVFQDILLLNELAQKMKAIRLGKGTLTFSIPKKSYKLDSKHFPESYTIQQRFEAHYLVEQCMLAANQKVAQAIAKSHGSNALLRRHKFPGPLKALRFEEFMRKAGLPIAIHREINFQKEVYDKINNSCLRSCLKEYAKYELIFMMEQAEYFLIGENQPQTWQHYALRMPTYTHFTSPIRRYPDILVHRQLISIIEGNHHKQEAAVSFHQKADNTAQKELQSLVRLCNVNKMAAKRVSTACQKVFLCLYLKTNPVQCSAILTTVHQWGISVAVPQYDFKASVQIGKNTLVSNVNVSTDNLGRAYMNLTYKDGKQNITLLFREFQQIIVQLGSTDSFPIDYSVKLVLPHPLRVGEQLIIQ